MYPGMPNDITHAWIVISKIFNKANGHATVILTIGRTSIIRITHIHKLLPTIAQAAPCNPITWISNQVSMTTTTAAADVETIKYLVRILAVNTVP